MTFSICWIITERTFSSELTVAVNHDLWCGRRGTVGWWRMMTGPEREESVRGETGISLLQVSRGFCGSRVPSVLLSSQLACFHCNCLWFPISFSLSWISGDQESLPFVCVWSEYASVLLSVKGKGNNPENKQNNKILCCLSRPRRSFPLIFRERWGVTSAPCFQRKSDKL